MIEAARAYPNFDVKLRFTTLLISEAELGNARALGKELLVALDGLVTTDGITFQNTVLMVCKEMRGAPLSEASLAPILSRLILLVTTLDYDIDRSAFSAFWNAKIGGGGQVYFVGLVAYKADRVERSARTLLYREASSRLAGFLEGNPASILLNLRTDLLVASVVNALADTETGAA